MNQLMLPYYKSRSKEGQKIRHRIWYRLNKQRDIDNHKKWRKKNKQKLKQNEFNKRVQAFKKVQSTLNCVRCGCTDLRFLEFNHKNGGGYKESQQKGVNGGLYYRINYGRKTDDLELLCRPCNHIHFLEMKFGCKIPLKVIFTGDSL